MLLQNAQRDFRSASQLHYDFPAMGAAPNFREFCEQIMPAHAATVQQKSSPELPGEDFTGKEDAEELRAGR